MEEEPKGFRDCLIPIIAFIGAGLIGKLFFYIIEEKGNAIATVIMTILALAFIVFVVRVIIGLKK